MLIATRSLGALAEINDRSGDVKIGEVIDVFIGSSILQTPNGHAIVNVLHYGIRLQDGSVICMLASDRTLKLKAIDRGDQLSTHKM